ncbi:acyl-CoA synthetase (AMP-forming)/AMP-acid ligase II [Anoxybacillus tepidamans]|uniref:Acyl-CoA synthetase (AMP-forming)/AMP-acid ligase II n=1 Tax=Anoxybacteroides tepidamans TaxID=265948 RepID=A0A7W8IMK2_9BACL|nr:class I adenylate-forming enzyme family protein [Anoxybacillus tepidamans]MBB5323285.1 acyl-CoA synthetase (AMP-forming)/AMP-acid ligase II [Anoxybacillus tepidamans]
MITEGRLYGRTVKMFAERPANVYEMLAHSAATFPTNEALIKGETRLNYTELKQLTDTLANNLMEKQIKKGDRIALLLGNEIEFVLTVLACAKIGAIFVPLNTKLTASELIYMMTNAGTKMLITNSLLVKPLEDWLIQSQFIQYCYLTDDQQPAKRMYSFKDELLKETPGSEHPYTSPSETEPLYIMYTSGTTGLPKGAVGSHINAIHSCLSYRHVLQTDHTVRTLVAIPLFHVTGLIGQLLHMMLVGGTVVLMERYQTETAIRLINQEKITFLFNVPTIYIMMMSHPLFNAFSYDFVRIVAYGGAPMSKETIIQLKRCFPNAFMHNAYGATETTSPTTIMPKHYSEEKTNSVGLPVPVADLRIVSEDGADCGPGEIGELYIKGPMVIKEYWNNKEANLSSFTEDGYWKSGDISCIDQDGFVYIMDRKKDVINRGGEKIYSIEIENILYAHPKILEAAVIGVKDPLFGEEIKAYIVKRPGEELTEEEVIIFAHKHLPKFKVPKQIEFIEELPRNPGGKILKKKLIEMSPENNQ